ncbi:hypothetical protein [Escherichia coli ISC41]|nr:hypothetical protein [Escherichia coli ISC41]
MADKVFQLQEFFLAQATHKHKKTMGIVMTQQGDAVAGELATEKSGH